jgi:hypothetical protein
MRSTLALLALAVCVSPAAAQTQLTTPSRSWITIVQPRFSEMLATVYRPFDALPWDLSTARGVQAASDAYFASFARYAEPVPTVVTAPPLVPSTSPVPARMTGIHAPAIAPNASSRQAR